MAIGTLVASTGCLVPHASVNFRFRFFSLPL